eukprot:scaffold5738_cov61-Phaeocystis_antarctica.AAC.10
MGGLSRSGSWTRGRLQQAGCERGGFQRTMARIKIEKNTLKAGRGVALINPASRAMSDRFQPTNQLTKAGKVDRKHRFTLHGRHPDDSTQTVVLEILAATLKTLKRCVLRGNKTCRPPSC